MVNLPLRASTLAPPHDPIPARLARPAGADDQALLATADIEAPIIGMSWTGPVAVDLATTPRIYIGIPPVAVSAGAAEATATTITKLITTQALRSGAKVTIISRSPGRYGWTDGLADQAWSDQQILDTLAALAVDGHQEPPECGRHVVILDEIDDVVRLARSDAAGPGARVGLERLLTLDPAGRLNVVAVVGYGHRPSRSVRDRFPVRVEMDTRRRGRPDPVRLLGVGSPVEFEVPHISDYQARRWATAGTGRTLAGEVAR